MALRVRRSAYDEIVKGLLSYEKISIFAGKPKFALRDFLRQTPGIDPYIPEWAIEATLAIAKHITKSLYDKRFKTKRLIVRTM